MSKLPNNDNANVPQEKITQYLLDPTSKHGKSKAQFFLSFGFTIEAWETMAASLKQHALTHEVASTRETPYGIHYNVQGALQTPDDRNPQVRSVWKIEKDETIPALVTAYPVRTDDETL
jgi:hypothetical protein